MMAVVEAEKTRNLASAIHLWCALVLVVFALSGGLILTMAGVIADAAHLEDEKSLIEHDINEQITRHARDQAQISHWDDAVAALTDGIDAAFVEAEIADWLWEDFGIDTTVVVSPDDAPAVMVFEDKVLAPEAAAPVISGAADLVAAARQRYRARRTATTGGYIVAGNPLLGSDRIYVADVRPIAGRMVFVVAQAIIPDRDLVLPEGPPPVLVTLKPAATNVLADLHPADGHGDLHIVARDEIPAHLASMPVGIQGDAHEAHAVWEMKHPSDIIVAQSLAPLLGLLIIAAAALFLVARRSGAALSALQQSEQTNRFLALHDALTELPNRMQFDQALENIIRNGRQHRCAILCVDLDRFKAVNDTHGHHAGDAVIKTIAGRIAKLVGESGIVARIGGDEFIIVLLEQLDRDSVLTRCERLIESVCQPVAFEGGQAKVGASIGVAWWPDDALTAKCVIRNADEALYRAKELGRGRACLAADPAAREPYKPVAGTNQTAPAAA